jgi:thiamine-phosphate pyrophosphorylase
VDDAFGLYLVLTDPVAGYEACAEAAVRHGVRFLQLRMKGAPAEAVVATAARIRSITRGSGTLFVVNDDVAVAREVDADGVHLGQDDMLIAEARRLWPAPGKLFGLSTHDEAQAGAAARLGADYVGIGPVWPTPTKAIPDPCVGPARAGAIARTSRIPAVAIGGIDAGNLAEVLRAGARNFCVVRAVNADPDPGSAIERLQEIGRRVVQA